MEPILGLDLGAWGLAAAVMQPSGLHVFPKKARLSGIVSVDRWGAAFVGDKARRKAVLEPDNTILCPTRLLGRLANDEAVKHSQVHQASAIGAGPAGLLTVELGQNQYAIPELVAQLIAELKRQAELELDEKISKVVCAVPVSFGDVQRQALRLAARIAGLKVLRIISSPMAMAISHNQEKESLGPWLVLDAGGSQIGAQIIDIHPQIFESIGFSSHSNLGALDVDSEILALLSQRFTDTVGPKLEQDRAGRTRLLLAISQAKQSLKQHPQVRIRLRELTKLAGEKVDFDDFLDRGSVNSASQAYAETVLASADEAMENAQILASDLQGCILGGGGSQLAQIPEDLGALIGRDKKLDFADWSDAARGAAIYAAALVSNPSMAAEDVKLIGIDQLSASIIASTRSGYHEVVLPAGCKLPISTSRVFTTSKSSQNQLRVLISQATSGKLMHAERLGEFVLDGLQQSEQQDPHIEMTFDVDSDGLLHIGASDIDSGNSTASDVRISESVAEQALSAVYQKRGLSEETIRIPITEARMPGAADDEV